MRGRLAGKVAIVIAAGQGIGLGRAGETAALALYLASDESSFTTGAIHIVEGGWIG